MATRRLPADEMYYRVVNTSSKRLAVAGLNLGPGQTQTVPARYVAASFNRSVELGNLQTAGLIAVSLLAPSLGVVAAVPLTSTYLKSLQAPSAGLLGASPVIPTANRPVPTLVPEGFGLFNSTTNLPNYSDGVVYRNAAGAPV